MSLDVAGLASRIAAGDRDAEEELVRRYSRGVTVILSQMTSDRTLVEDLRQETFCKIIEKVRAGELREPERLAGFVCNLARNLAIDHYRRASRRGETVRIEEASAQPSPALSPFDQVLRRESAALMRRVLEELPAERDRQILYRFYVREQDKDSICGELGLSSLQFNRVLHRARQRFRERYQKAASEPPGGIKS